MRAILIVSCAQLLGITALVIMHWQHASAIPHAIATHDIAPITGTADATPQAVSAEQVREWVTQAVHSSFAAAAPTNQLPQPLQTVATRVPEYNRAAVERIEAEMHYFESLQEVTSADIERLQTNIVRLHPSARAQLMNQLTQALNDGRINGRLL